MNRLPLWMAAAFAAAATNVSQAQPDPFADRVVAYEPGTAFEGGYTNALAALGAPAVATPGEFGGPVTPLAPPFLKEQLVSVGAGGHLVLAFDPPVFDHPANPFGMDWILYGNTGFAITNSNFSGGGITDGTLFGQTEAGATRVSVSADGAVWFPLDAALAPTIDRLFPSDSSGRAGLPVNPSLTPADFAGAGLSRIRKLYRQSAGGTSYDLGWARDANGHPANLPAARFVRIDVLRGKAEVDAAAAVMPTGETALRFVETFAEDPAANGWATTGSTLFQWDTAAERLAVQWDSSQPNSYFHRPLGLTFDIQQDFSLAFDLELDAIEIGTTPGKPFTFPIAVGLIDLAQATRSGFFRGAGIHPVHGPRGVVEWNYLPDSRFGATISSGLISQDNQWAFQNTFPLVLETGTLYHIRMKYDAGAGKLKTAMTANGQPFGPIRDARLSEIFGDTSEGSFSRLAVDTLAISSYSDNGQSPPETAGSVRAAGHIDNFTVETIASLQAVQIRRIETTGGRLQITFPGQAGRDYWLEQTGNFADWITIRRQPVQATGPAAFRIAPEEAPHAFFRIRGQAR